MDARCSPSIGAGFLQLVEVDGHRRHPHDLVVRAAQRLDGGLLHDLRNPLAGARGALQILRDRTENAADKAILGEVIARLDEMAEKLRSVRIDER